MPLEEESNEMSIPSSRPVDVPSWYTVTQLPSGDELVDMSGLTDEDEDEVAETRTGDVGGDVISPALGKESGS